MYVFCLGCHLNHSLLLISLILTCFIRLWAVFLILFQGSPGAYGEKGEQGPEGPLVSTYTVSPSKYILYIYIYIYVKPS